MTTTPQRAAIYCRLSYAPDGSEEKVDRQEADCRELAQRLGWEISEAHVFKDNSRSAWQRNRKRPGWDALLAAVEAGGVDCIICYHGDRLMRQPYDLEKLISAADMKGIRIASVSGTRDLDSADDRFILRIEVAQACRESDNTSRRVHRGIKARAGKGLSQVGGLRPFGFGVQTGTREKVDSATGEVTHVPVYDRTQQVPEEAAILVKAVERLLAGQSQVGVVRWMRTQCTTSQGKQWTDDVFRKMLLRPRIAGLVEYQGTLSKAAWEPIIPQDVWEDVKALYQRNSEEYRYPGPGRKHLLSRVAECGYGCGTVHFKIVGGKRRRSPLGTYWCPACKKISRNAEYLDAYITGRTIATLNSKRIFRELDRGGDDGPSVSAQIAALQRRRTETQIKLENIADFPDLDPAVVAASLASFDRKVRQLRDQLAASAQHRLLVRMAGITPERWAHEPMDVQAAVVKGLFQVIILPSTRRGPGFDPASVDVQRRPVPGATEETNVDSGRRQPDIEA
jgi:DNA invertase Pin-like site-specific DNA recombinase